MCWYKLHIWSSRYFTHTDNSHISMHNIFCRSSSMLVCYSKQPKIPRNKNQLYFILTAARDYGRSGCMMWLLVTASNHANSFCSWFWLNVCEGCFSPYDRSLCTKASKTSSSLPYTFNVNPYLQDCWLGV